MKIAIVKLSALGDIVHAMVVLQFIKESMPHCRIDWIVEERFVEVLEGNPHIHTILPVNLKAIKKDKKQLLTQISLVKKYAKNNYDLVIDAQGLIKSAITATLLGKRRAGFSKKSIREGLASYLYTEKTEIAYDANTIDRNTKVIASPLGMHISTEMILRKAPFLFYKKTDRFDTYLNKTKKNILFIIGSTWESRNYPKEKFAEIANALKENVLIVWGNEEEKQRAEWIVEHSKFAKKLPKTTLSQLKEIISYMDLVIGNDTGPTHMAWGLNIPSITIFGPTPVSRVYQTVINKVIKSASYVDPYKLNKKDFSIKDIQSKEIVMLAEELLK